MEERLDRFLAGRLGLSRSRCADLILKGLVQVLPQEGGPEGGVAIDDVLPRAGEGGGVQVAAQRPTGLFEIDARLWCV